MGKRAPDNFDTIIGAKIRERRKQLGMTQSDLAEALDLTFQQVQKYERGVNRITVSTLIRIAQALDCGVKHLLPEQVTVEAAAVELPLAQLATSRGGIRLAQCYLDMDPARQHSLLAVAEAIRTTNDQVAA